MVDQERVCCMCGDVGFPDKLFQCSRCRFRLQHSYCSNYYYGNESSSTTTCDWCLSEGKNSSSTSSTKHHSKRSSSLLQMDNPNVHIRSEYTSGGRIKQIDQGGERATTTNVNRNSGIPSPRTATRRYKLLKDVMC